MTDTADLTHPSLYFNRELSLLEFNRRVLKQALNEHTPLLERLRFICIASSNLDEFFEIRVAGLKQQVAYGSTKAGLDGLSPTEALKRIADTCHAIVEEQYHILNNVLLPQLEEHDIRFIRRQHWSQDTASWVRSFFHSQVLPVVSPIGLDLAHPFPRLVNKSLNFIVTLEGKDAFGRDSGLAILQAPRSLPRIIRVPSDSEEQAHNFIFLSSIIHAHAGDLFPGMQVTGCYQFRLTRNADLELDEDGIDDLATALKGELQSRRYGNAVRLEVADNCPLDVVQFLAKEFKLTEQDIYQVNGPVNLNRMMAVPDLVERPALKYPSYSPAIPARLQRSSSIFEAISQGDVLLHHPFDSFSPVIDFVRQAASDPDVLAIKQTLYRTGHDSLLEKALVSAAQAGKEVTAVVELRARFDEEANLELANTLQEAGALVVYGIMGYKTHAKMTLVVRREQGQLKRYVHLGTGNYHARTARFYTDYGLLSCDPVLGEDVHSVFQLLTGMGKVQALQKMLHSPFTLFPKILDYIDYETEQARQGQPAHIIGKMNQLTEPKVIQALYRASQAGVKVDLVIRGLCCLRPGIPGVSDNIQVRSIIGRFLEHTRVYYFLHSGEEKVFCSSADWMERNLHRRVETCFPVEEPELAEAIKQQGLFIYLKDNCESWVMQADGRYELQQPAEGQPALSAQPQLLEQICR